MPNKRFRQVYLEITNCCNLKCDFCPSTRRKAAFMEMTLFRHIVPQLPELAGQVYFHVMGEPLLHPEFPAMVEFCAAHGLPVAITTNGSQMATPAATALLHPGIRQVNISVHAISQNAENEQRLQEIFNFTRQALTSRPDLYINFRLWNLAHLRDKPADNNLWLLQQIRAAFPEAVPADELSGGHKSRRMTGRLYLSFDTVFDWPEITPDVPVRERGFCHGLCHQLAILVDGTVVPCCLDRDGVIELGNAAQTPIAEILAAPRATAMLDGLAHGRLVEDLCHHCTFCRRFKQARTIGS